MASPIAPIPLPEFRARLATIYTAAARAPKTRQQLDHALRLAEAAGVTTTAGLTTTALADLIVARGPAANPNTTRGLLGRLRRCVNLAIRLRHLDRDDAPDWAALRPEAAPPRCRGHTAAEVGRLLDRLGAATGDWFAGRLLALASFVAYTGLRRNEALYCRVADLDLEAGFVFVSPRRQLKTRASAAPVPLPDALVPTLAAWVPRCGGSWLFPGARREGPWVGGAPGYRPLDRLRQAGSAAGIEQLGFHSLRHTLGTELLTGGVPLWAIQHILRHTTPLTTAHYLHPSDHAVAGHVRGFRYGRGSAA